MSQLSDAGWVALNTILDEAVVREVIPKLKAAGATGIVEYPLSKGCVVRSFGPLALSFRFEANGWKLWLERVDEAGSDFWSRGEGCGGFD